MEPYNRDSLDQNKPERTSFSGQRSGRVAAGVIVVIVGVIFLARELGYYFPYWIFRPEMLLIVLGLFIGFKHSFKNLTWLVLVLLGSIFLLDDIFPYSDFSDYAWPLVIIGVGLIMIFRPGRRKNYWKEWETGNSGTHHFDDDHISSTIVFGGVKKNIISKNFKGGEVTTIFGGTDIDLMQADIEGKIVLEVTQVFGGTKLIVPPHWRINSTDLVAVFGGVEDKRPPASASLVDGNKVLVLTGACIFGGIDIKSY